MGVSIFFFICPSHLYVHHHLLFVSVVATLPSLPLSLSIHSLFLSHSPPPLFPFSLTAQHLLLACCIFMRNTTSSPRFLSFLLTFLFIRNVYRTCFFYTTIFPFSFFFYVPHNGLMSKMCKKEAIQKRLSDQPI